MKYILSVFIVLLFSNFADAQGTRYYIALFDKDHSQIVDNQGRLNVSASNLHTVELNSNSIVLDLEGEIIAVVVKEIVSSYAPRGVMTSDVLNLASQAELRISLNTWQTIMIQEYFVNGDVYNTFYGRVKENNRIMWKVIHKVKAK